MRYDPVQVMEDTALTLDGPCFMPVTQNLFQVALIPGNALQRRRKLSFLLLIPYWEFAGILSILKALRLQLANKQIKSAEFDVFQHSEIFIWKKKKNSKLNFSDLCPSASVK